jgi:hypothetical protein
MEVVSVYPTDMVMAVSKPVDPAVEVIFFAFRKL